MLKTEVNRMSEHIC